MPTGIKWNWDSSSLNNKKNWDELFLCCVERFTVQYIYFFFLVEGR